MLLPSPNIRHYPSHPTWTAQTTAKKKTNWIHPFFVGYPPCALYTAPLGRPVTLHFFGKARLSSFRPHETSKIGFKASIPPFQRRAIVTNGQPTLTPPKGHVPSPPPIIEWPNWWWFRPIWKIFVRWVRLDHFKSFPQVGMKINHIWNHHPGEKNHEISKSASISSFW